MQLIIRRPCQNKKPHKCGKQGSLSRCNGQEPVPIEDIEPAAGEHSELTCYEDFVNVLIMALTDDKNSQYLPEEQQYEPELGEEAHG